MKGLEELALTTTDIASVLPKIIVDQVEEVARAKRVGRSLVRVNRDLVGAKGRSLYIPKRGALTAYSLSEGEDLSSYSTKATYSTVQITPSKIGLQVKITQEAIDGCEFDLIKDHILEAGEAIADKEDKDIITELLTASTSIDAATTGTLAFGDIVKARNKVLTAKYNPNALVIHPDQEADLLQDDRFIDASAYGAREPILNGEIGKIAGLKVFVTQNMTSGKAIVLDTTRAAVLAIKRELTLKRWDNPSTDSVELNFYMEYGVEIVNDDAICIINNC